MSEANIDGGECFTHQETMLKLTMNPRKRSKRTRVFNPRFRHHQSKSTAMEIERKSIEQREMISDNLSALLKLEYSGIYSCADYMNSMTEWKLNIYDLLQKERLTVAVQQSVDSQIDEYCREQIVEWTFRVVDYFRIDREVVVLSLSLLDRFLAICKCDRSSFKLAATTTLYLAVKLLHPCQLSDLGILSDLSRGEFDMADVALMEKQILDSLKWKLHPPTSIAFVTLLLDLYFNSQSVDMSLTDIDDLYDISAFFTELAVCDFYFVGYAPSIVSLACICNALEGMFGPENKTASRILKMARRINICRQEDLSSLSHRLWELYERSEECALHNNLDQTEEEEKLADSSDIFVSKETCNDGSPVSVNNQCNSMTSNEVMCAMRSQTLRNGSW